jgi:hypothetical protein
MAALDGRSFRGRLAQAEIAATQHVVVLEGFDGRSEADFAAPVGAAIRAGLQPVDVAAEFKVGTGTVSRWKDGISCPAEYARAIVAERIAGMLADRVRAMRAVAAMSLS